MTNLTSQLHVNRINDNNGKKKATLGKRFWDDLREIAGPRFESWNSNEIPRNNDMSRLVRSLRYVDPEQITPLAIAILKRGGTQTSSTFREFIAQLRRIPEEHERAFVMALINHSSMKKHEGIFELFDHSHWIRDPQLRTAIIRAGIDATPQQLREKVGSLKIVEPRYTPGSSPIR